MTAKPHDLPLCPKARVHRSLRGWAWHHKCLWHGHLVAQGGYQKWELAMSAADDHMKHCEAI